MTTIDSAAETKAPKMPVAVKEYVLFDAAGAGTVVDDISKANGFRYTSIKGKNPDGSPLLGKTANINFLDYDANVRPGARITMLALFGASTLGTNQASFNRNSAKAEDEFADDADAVEERFGRMEDGNWGAKGGGGFGIDVNVLWEAVCEVKGGAEWCADKDAWIKTVTENTQTRRELRNHAKIEPVYDRIIRERRAPKVEKDLDSLLSF